MSMIAFNFTSISGERKIARVEKYSVKNETQITDIKPLEIGKQKALLFKFTNQIDFEPGVGHITLKGEVLMLANDADAKSVPEAFAKTKTVDPKYIEEVYNNVLSRAAVQSLILARDLNLPTPLNLPRVRPAPEAVAAAASAAATKAAPVKKDEKKKK